MQRRNVRKLKLKCKSDNLETGLSKPEDEQLFYSASVQFLRKQLEYKSHHQLPKETVSTQSYCSINKPVQISSDRESYHKNSIESSLSMRQVLPFPKTNKINFFLRLKNTFKKFYLKSSSFDTEDDDTGTSNISNFKFPRCEQCDGLHSSCLKNAYKENCKTYKLPCSSNSN